MKNKTLTRYIMYDRIHQLRYEEHRSIQWIATFFKINFRTVKKYLDMSQKEFDKYIETVDERPRKLDQYKEFIKDKIENNPDCTSAWIHDQLKESFPFFPKTDTKTVYNYVTHCRQEFGIPKVIQQRQYFIMQETPPGKYAQVDFGEKKLRDGNGILHKIYFFAMLLCHSRYKFICLQEKHYDSQTAIEAHEKAFSFFQGIPHEIIYDQDAVFLHDENLGDYCMTELFKKYTNSRPYRVTFCRPADPESKGGVENVIKYVKQNFLYGRQYVDIDILNKEALAWLNRTGNMTKHNTTYKIPYQVWSTEECKTLLPWAPILDITMGKGHKVLKTNSIRYQGNSYSLPFGTYIDKETKVFLSEQSGELIIKNEFGNEIARHHIPPSRGNIVINNNHRRNKSVKIPQLKEELRTLFSYSEDIEIFIVMIEKKYPRYVRDQFQTLLNCSKKSDHQIAENALNLCVANNLFSANDFKSVLLKKELKSSVKKDSVNEEIKPLGDDVVRMMVNIEPNKSDINTYEQLFNKINK